LLAGAGGESTQVSFRRFALVPFGISEANGHFAIVRVAVGSYRLLTNFISMERRKGQQSIYKLQKMEREKEQAHDLYKQGLTLREIAAEMGKSYGWVWRTKQDVGWDEIALPNNAK
jgi:hypothetical protein